MSFLYRQRSYFYVSAFVTIFLIVRNISNLHVDSQVTDRTTCFHNLTESDGEFHSVNFPGFYPDGLKCIWLINAEPGKRIKLIFTEFELEDFDGCAHDSLSIFDGNSTESPFLGNFCGTSIQQQIFSSSNTLFLILNTNNFNSMKGFHAVYRTYSCGGVITSKNGTINSPFFPHLYRSNSICIWRIPVKQHHRVILNVTLFTVKTEKPICKDNYVRISSLDEMKRTKQHELFCGSILHAPSAILSEGSEVEVEYSSSNVLDSLFAAKFYTVQDECSLNISKCEQMCEKTLDGYTCSCRDTYKLNDDGHGCSFVNCSYSVKTSGFGEILTAGYPTKYPAYHRCKWEITADRDEQILFKFEDFDLENSPGCRYDVLEIYEDNGNASTSLGNYCGPEIPMPISSSTNRVFLFFRTDGLLENKGFKIKHITSKSCGGIISTNETMKTISSPFYPGAYPDNLHCVWEITAPELHVIVLNFTSFDLQNMAENKDKVMVFSKNSENESYLLAEFSGSHLPREILSDTNYIKIDFVSYKPLRSGTGFSADLYSEENECFLNNGGCSHICNKAVGSISCSCPKGYLFISESSCVKDTCQYEVTSNSGVIKMPDFVHIHPINNTCHWLITTEEHKTLFLNFTLLRRAGCKDDRLEMYFGSNTTGNLCAENLSTEFTSPGNQIELVYTKIDRNQTSEVLATFFSVFDECSINNGGCQHYCEDTLHNYECSCQIGYVLHENKHNCTQGSCFHTITSNTGFISTPEYPNPYPLNIECAWLFKTSIGNRLKLTFTSFDIHVESETGCAYDSVSVYDGDGENSQLLGQFCGNKDTFDLLSTSNSLLITFTSDFVGTFSGFAAEYTSVCGGHILLENEQELFSHVDYGNIHYADNSDCDWKVIAGANKRIVVSFQALNLEADDTCRYDYVAIYEKDGSEILKSCGNSVPRSFTSNSNVLSVQFHSDGSNTYTGFWATFRSV